MNQIKVPAKTEHLYAVLDFIANHSKEVSDEARDAIAMAAEEIFVNIANYAYENGNGDVGVLVLSDDHAIAIEFIDSGAPFNPLEKSDPDMPGSVEEAQIGGLGILMVKELMDSVSYRREDNRNIFSITKNKEDASL